MTNLAQQFLAYNQAKEVHVDPNEGNPDAYISSFSFDDNFTDVIVVNYEPGVEARKYALHNPAYAAATVQALAAFMHEKGYAPLPTNSCFSDCHNPDSVDFAYMKVAMPSVSEVFHRDDFHHHNYKSSSNGNFYLLTPFDGSARYIVAKIIKIIAVLGDYSEMRVVARKDFHEYPDAKAYFDLQPSH